MLDSKEYSIFTMPNMFYYLDNNCIHGPITPADLSDLIAKGRLTPHVLIARKGDKNWQAFSALFPNGISSATPPGTQPFPPTPPQPPGARQIPLPDNYMVFSILTTLFCCLPFGIVAIIKSASVESLYAQGQYEEAKRASASARTWCIWAALSAAVCYLLAPFLYLAIAVLLFSDSTARSADHGENSNNILRLDPPVNPSAKTGSSHE